MGDFLAPEVLLPQRLPVSAASSSAACHVGA